MTGYSVNLHICIMGGQYDRLFKEKEGRLVLIYQSAYFYSLTQSNSWPYMYLVFGFRFCIFYECSCSVKLMFILFWRLLWQLSDFVHKTFYKWVTMLMSIDYKFSFKILHWVIINPPLFVYKMMMSLGHIWLDILFISMAILSLILSIHSFVSAFAFFSSATSSLIVSISSLSSWSLSYTLPSKLDYSILIIA